MIVIEELVAAVDTLVDADPQVLRDGDTVLALRRQLARLECVAARSAAAFDAGRAWASDGTKSAGAWLAWKTCARPEATSATVRLGRAVRSMPLVEAAWAAGDITADHVNALAAVRKPSTEEAFARDEAILVDDARRLKYTEFTKAVTYWLQLNGEDDADKRAAKQVEDRAFRASTTFGGSVDLKGLLDPVRGTIFREELRRLEKKLFEADWKAAKERLGREPTLLDLERTASQRRADALVEMARRSAAMPAGARKPRPLFTVLVGYETLAGPIRELANGQVVTPGSLVPWLADADIQRVVFIGRSRVIEVGETTRFFTGALRRAVQVRDGTCFHPSCDEPAEYCEIDHITESSKGGPTTQANGRPACRFHNNLRNRRPDRDGDPP